MLGFLKKKVNITFIFLAISLIFYFAFGFYHIDKFDTADEHYWIYDFSLGGRIGQYWDAVGDFRWADTFINDKPGVSLAFVSGLGKLFYQGEYNDLFSDGGYFRIYNPEKIKNILFYHRLPLLIFNGLMGLVFYWLLRKYTKNQWLSLWASIFVILNPILIGVSQIVNPDSLLWIFFILSILTFLNYLECLEKKFIYLTILFFGLALLSKYAALILAILFFVFLVIHLFYFSLNGERDFHKIIIKLSLSYFLIFFSSLIFYAILFPVMLMDLKLFYLSILGFGGMEFVFVILGISNLALILDAVLLKSKIVLFIFNILRKTKKLFPTILYILIIALFVFVLYNFGTNYSLDNHFRKIPFDTDRGVTFKNESVLNKIILEVLPITFSLIPVSLFFFLFIIFKSVAFPSKNSKLIFMLVSSIVIFYGAMVYQRLLADIRYSIMMYPILAVLSAIGMWEFSELWVFRKIKKAYLTGGLIIVSVVSIWLTKPFYFNYTNFILPENILIADAWGYGGYEAAEYLNSLPDAENLVVWADYNGFCSFFKGKCVKGNRDWKLFYKAGNEEFDYYIKTRRGSVLYGDVWKRIGKFEKEPVWKIGINGRDKNYIMIYKSEDKE